MMNFDCCLLNFLARLLTHSLADWLIDRLTGPTISTSLKRIVSAPIGCCLGKEHFWCRYFQLFIHCRVMTREWTTKQARALLHQVSSTSFITEHLAQRLWLPHNNWHMQIAGIGGPLHDPSSHIISFGVSRLLCKGDRRPSHQLWGVEAVVVPKISACLPGFQVLFNLHWKHLTGLCLADQGFGVPGPIGVLLGVDACSHIPLHGQWSGPSRTLSALEMHFRWVLSVQHSMSIPNSQQFPVSLLYPQCRTTYIMLKRGTWKTNQGFGGVVVTSRPQSFLPRWNHVAGTFIPTQ